MGTTLSCLLLDAISTTAYLFLETLKMEISNKNLLALALALMALVSTGFALQCHQCNSYENADCDDPMSDLQADGSRVVKTNEFLKDCPADGNTYTLCRKIDQTIRGHESVIRSCGFEEKTNREGEKLDCYKTVLEEYSTYVCTCDTDGCNGSSHIEISIFATMITTALALMLK